MLQRTQRVLGNSSKKNEGLGGRKKQCLCCWQVEVASSSSVGKKRNEESICNCLVDIVEEVVGMPPMGMKRVDGFAEEVEVDDERDSVGSGCEAAGDHERPVDAVGAGEEALEGDSGRRRVRVVVGIV